MELKIEKTIRQILCLRVLPKNEWNTDPNSPKKQQTNEAGQLLYSHEVLLYPAGGGDALQVWLTAPHGATPPRAGDVVQIDGLTLRLYTDRRDKNKPRFAVSGKAISRLA